MSEHVCAGDVAVCSCGRRWDFFRVWSDGSRSYTSAEVVTKYRAIYGKPDVPFQPVEVSDVTR